MRLDYIHLRTLALVERLGSFEGAAAALRLTPSAVSQRIRALEEQVGTVLLVRSHPVTATEAARPLIRHVRNVDLLEAGLWQDLALEQPSTVDAPPTVRLAVNADSLGTWLIPALAKVEGLLFDIVVDDQDHSADWLRRGDVMAAITGSPGPIVGCQTYPLGALRYVATASPAFMARWFPGGVTPERLGRAPALSFDTKDRLQIDWAAAEAGRPVSLTTHHLPSTEGFIEAASLGLGWGLNPEVLVQRHLAEGTLVRLSDTPLDTPLYWQVARMTAAPLSGLTKAIRARAQAVLRPPAKG